MKHVPKGREERETARDRDPRTREAKTARDRDPRTRETKKSSANSRLKVTTATRGKCNTWRRTEHSASSQEANDNWTTSLTGTSQSWIINTDQKGSCLSPRQRISETRLKADQSKIETCDLDNLKRMCENPCVLFYDELSGHDNKGIE